MSGDERIQGVENSTQRILKALCAAVAHEVLGNPRRGEEVRSAVEAALTQRLATSEISAGEA